MSLSATNITITAPAPRKEGLRTFTLPRVAPDEFKNPGRSYKITLSGYYLNSRFVSRCQLTAESPGDPATVIVKFATARGGASDKLLERREREAIRYFQDLKALQGKEVPEFLGFYKGEDPWGQRWACILLEDCGDNVRHDEFEMYGVRLGLALAQFHLKAHLNYNNILPKHTVVRGDRLVLVNFNKVRTHDCQFEEVIEGLEFHQIIAENLADPGIKRIRCDEIHRYCTRMELFIPAGYKYKYTLFFINAGMKGLEDLETAVKRIYPEPKLARDIACWCEETWPLIEPHLAKYARAPWSMSRNDRKRVREQQREARLGLPAEEESRTETHDEDEVDFDKTAWYCS